MILPLVSFGTRLQNESNNIVEGNLGQLVNVFSGTSDFPGWRSGLAVSDSAITSHSNDATSEERQVIPCDPDDTIGRIPIAAPVPLPFSARSKDVLKKMCSLPPKRCTSAVTRFSRRTQSTGLSSGSSSLRDSLVTNRLLLPDIHSCQRYAQLSSSIDERVSPSPDGLASCVGPQGPFVIRPITPLTLIALTEPCLMAFCGTPTPIGHFPTASVAYMATCNSWGY